MDFGKKNVPPKGHSVRKIASEIALKNISLKTLDNEQPKKI